MRIGDFRLPEPEFFTEHAMGAGGPRSPVFRRLDMHLFKMFDSGFATRFDDLSADLGTGKLKCALGQMLMQITVTLREFADLL